MCDTACNHKSSCTIFLHFLSLLTVCYLIKLIHPTVWDVCICGMKRHVKSEKGKEIKVSEHTWSGGHPQIHFSLCIWQCVTDRLSAAENFKLWWRRPQSLVEQQKEISNLLQNTEITFNFDLWEWRDWVLPLLPCFLIFICFLILLFIIFSGEESSTLIPVEINVVGNTCAEGFFPFGKHDWVCRCVGKLPR